MDISRAQVLSALKKGKAEKKKEEIEYIRFREEAGKIPRGTVVLKNRVVPGFQRIKRIFSLEKGIERNMRTDEAHIEEKIDGYNVRVAKTDGMLYAFSRGGFIDAFSTEKARGMGLEKFFERFPAYVLCGEMLGNTPFTKPAKKYDVRFLVFDICREDGAYIRGDEKYAILKKYGIESVPVLGRFSIKDKKKLKDIALAANRNGLEGLVIKSTDRENVVKYVTPDSDISDIRDSILFDMPAGFFIQRVFRSGLFIHDFSLDKEKYFKKLGQAFYESVWNDLGNVKGGRGAEQAFEILIKDPGIWENIRRHMSKEVKLEIIFRREEKAGTRIGFRKIYKKTTKKIHDALMGKGVTD